MRAVYSALKCVIWAYVAIVLLSCPSRAWRDLLAKVAVGQQQDNSIDSAADDLPGQREALLSLYGATNGGYWVSFLVDANGTAHTAWAWASRNTSYCR